MNAFEIVAGGAVGWNSGTVHAVRVLKKERAPAVNRGSVEQATTYCIFSGQMDWVGWH